MAKKIWYSNPLSYCWDNYEQNRMMIPNLTPEQFYANVIPIVKKRDTALSMWQTWADDVQGKLVHIFLEEGLKEFLCEMPIPHVKEIIQYLSDNGERKLLRFENTSKENQSCLYHSFGLHIPYEGKKEGVAFQVVIYGNDKVELMFSKSAAMGGCSLDLYRECEKSDEPGKQTIAAIFRLGINLLAYMECYPECVHDGVPEALKEEYRQSNRKTIVVRTSPDVLDMENSPKGSKRPHFRRGFFRRLTSDFYTKKKGQLVFSHATLVNGRAKTVLKNEK